jgi:prepilin-type N-terminal cleavage/methylation domain-containing protein
VRRKGFTLLELVLTVAIILIIVTLAAPSLSHYVARTRLRLTALGLVQDLRDMQANAVAEDSFYTIVFVTNENRYYVRPGTRSYAPPGTVKTERSLSRFAGFPLARGKRVPVSAVFARGGQERPGFRSVRSSDINDQSRGYHEFQRDGQTGWRLRRRPCQPDRRV